MMMLKSLSIFCLLASCHSFPSPAEESALDLDIRGENLPEPSIKPSDVSETDDKKTEKIVDGKCMRDGKLGKCVPYYLCNAEVDHVSGAGLIDINFENTTCKSSIDICCDEKNIMDAPAQDKEPEKSVATA